MNKICRKP